MDRISDIRLLLEASLSPLDIGRNGNGKPSYPYIKSNFILRYAVDIGEILTG